MTKDNRPFPMQQLRDSIAIPKSIPWWIAEMAHKEYCDWQGGGSDCQTLERLAERGGFSWTELGWFLSQALKKQDKPATLTGPT